MEAAYCHLNRYQSCGPNPLKKFLCIIMPKFLYRKQRTLTVGGSIIVWLVSSLTRLHWTASLNTNKIIFSSLVSSSLVKLETSCTVIVSPTVSVLCSGGQPKFSRRRPLGYAAQRKLVKKYFKGDSRSILTS